MPPNFNNSKIYKIVSLNENENMVYYGSTTQPLSLRMADHRKVWRYWKEGKRKSVSSNSILFDEYGVDNCVIVLCENYPCNDVYELHSKEAEYIKNNQCVNKVIPTRTHKEHYEDNRTKILLNQKKYNEDNVIRIKGYKKQYNEVNKAKIKEKQKQRYNENIDAIKIKRQLTVNCLCGTIYTLCHKVRHEKSKKHQQFINI